MISKTIKFLSVSLLSHKEGGFFLILMPSEVVSGPFQTTLASYSLFRVVPLFRSNDVTECFDLNFYFKETSCRFLLQSGAALMHILQSRTIIIAKRDSLFVLQSRRSGITEQGTYYKLEQIVIQNAEAATRGVLLKKRCSQKFRKTHRKTLTPESPLYKVPGLRPLRLWHRCFPVNFTKFLRTPFLQNMSGRLLPKI